MTLSRAAVLVLTIVLTACAPQDDAFLLADAGPARTGQLSQEYTFDASASLASIWSWRLVQTPSGSGLNEGDLQEADTPWPVLRPDVEGVYVLELLACESPALCEVDYTEAYVGPQGLAWLTTLRPFSGRKGLGAYEDTDPLDAYEDTDPVDFRGRFGRGLGVVEDAEPLDVLEDTDPVDFKGRLGGGLGVLEDSDPVDFKGRSNGESSSKRTGLGVYEDYEPLDFKGRFGEGLGVYGDTDPLDFKGQSTGESFSKRKGLGVVEDHEPLDFKAHLAAKGNNTRPVAVATARQGLRADGTVFLQGDDSYDPDGDTLRYRWTFASIPAGSNLDDSVLEGSTQSGAAFTPDVPGLWQVRLTVRDSGFGDSDIVTLETQ